MKEKTLKDVHAGIREFYTRAVDFERKENWEFAINCMLEVVLRVPGFTEAREKLRGYEKQYTKKINGMDAFVSQVKGFFALAKIKKITSGNPVEALGECEKILALNLNNPPVLQALADAAVKAANVSLIEVRVARGMGGKCFVTMTGEVSDVKAAVEAGARIAAKDGVLIGTEVIANPHPELWESIL